MGGGSAGTTFHADAGEVFLLGKVDEAMTGTRRDLLAHIDAPTSPIIGFPSVGYDPTKVQLSPDGRLLYVDLVRHQLLALVTDPWLHVGAGSAYPSDAGTNDDVVATPMCNGDLQAFWVRPDTGGVVYQCSGTTFYEGSTDQTALDGKTIVALGFNNTALVRAGSTDQSIDASGTSHAITGLGLAGLSGVGREVRATATVFEVPLAESAAATAPCDKYSIDPATGTATNAGTFANLPGAVTVQFGCGGPTARIDSTGNLLSVAQEGTAQVIYARPLIAGTATRLYTEANGTQTNFASYPPTMQFTWWGTGSSLVTGP
jgi:hypothetical protein